MNNNAKKLKNIIWHSYARCSTEKQTKSTSAQFEQSRQICEKYGWNLSEKMFEDFGVSGTEQKNWTEGNLGRFFDAVDNGQIETPCGLILESLQRFSRSDGLDVAQKFREYIRKGVFIHFVHKSFTYELDDISGDKWVNLMAIFVEAQGYKTETEQRERNQARGIRDKQQRFLNGEIDHYSTTCPAWIENEIVGQWADGKPRYKYVLNKKKAEIVRRIYDEKFQGVGTMIIAKNLNKDGVPNISGKDVPWTGIIVANILRNRAVYGLLTLYKNEKTEDKYGNITRKKVVQRDEDGNIVGRIVYPKCISENLFKISKKSLKN